MALDGAVGSQLAAERASDRWRTSGAAMAFSDFPERYFWFLSV